jgi:hypothetical protein
VIISVIYYGEYQGVAMIAYVSNELISSSQFTKKFGAYLAQIKNYSVEKLAILKKDLRD